jgi:hypothetical protein
MQNKHIHHYHGYRVLASAHRLPDGSFSANLLLERHGAASGADRYRFDALDYFDNEEQALRYSCDWGRGWVDTRG